MSSYSIHKAHTQNNMMKDLLECPHSCDRCSMYTTLRALKDHLMKTKKFHRACSPDCKWYQNHIKVTNGQNFKWRTSDYIKPKRNPEKVQAEEERLTFFVQAFDVFEETPFLEFDEPETEPEDQAPITDTNNSNRSNRATSSHRGLWKQCEKLMLPGNSRDIGNTLYHLGLKEMCGISDEAYSFLKRVKKLESWPTLYAIKEARKNLNINIDKTIIHTTEKGIQRSVKKIIENCLKKESNLQNGKEYRFKFGMDGASVANDRNIKQVVATIERIHEEEFTNKSPYESHCVGIALCDEEYEDLEENFREVFNDIEKYHDSKFTVKDANGKEIEVKVNIIITLDMPLLLTVLGFSKQFYNKGSAVTSKHCCYRCKIQSNDRARLRRAASPLLLRTIDELYSEDPNINCGVSKKPILRVPLDKFVICKLHMDVAFVRKLLELLCKGISRCGEDVEDKFAKKLEEIVMVKIADRLTKSKKKRTMVQRGQSFWLTHVRAMRILKKYEELVGYLPQDRQDKVLPVWNNFMGISEVLSKIKLSAEDISTFNALVDNFQKNFLKVYGSASFTPYMHEVVCHVPVSLKKYGTLITFSNYGLESLHALNKRLLVTRSSKFKGFTSSKKEIAHKQVQVFERMKHHMENIYCA